jgi:hypothetical protein
MQMAAGSGFYPRGVGIGDGSVQSSSFYSVLNAEIDQAVSSEFVRKVDCRGNRISAGDY